MNESNAARVPSWARGIDDYGRRKWRRDLPGKTRRGEYIGNAIVNLIFLWIVNKVPDWHLPFILSSYNVILWMLNLNLIVQAAGYGLMALTDMAAIRRISRIVMETSSFVTAILIFYIYPFDFSNFYGLFWLDIIIPIFLVIGMVVSVLKIFANFWKLLFWR